MIERPRPCRVWISFLMILASLAAVRVLTLTAMAAEATPLPAIAALPEFRHQGVVLDCQPNHPDLEQEETEQTEAVLRLS